MVLHNLAAHVKPEARPNHGIGVAGAGIFFGCIEGGADFLKLVFRDADAVIHKMDDDLAVFLLGRHANRPDRLPLLLLPVFVFQQNRLVGIIN
mgnify:CR=1 FL=1